MFSYKTLAPLVLFLSFPLRAATNEAAAIDEIITRYERLGRFSGAVLVARDGKVILAKGYGLANREHRVPNRADTRFLIGSMSKPFTAAAILKLASEGKLKLDDPIIRHLPDYPPAQGEKVTIAQLLAHSSGIPSTGRRGDGLEDIVENAEPVTLHKLMSYSHDRALLHAPGSAYRYSNTGYNILAAIVEGVSGQPFYDYLREAVLASTGMKNTGPMPWDEVVPDLASGYLGYEPEVRRGPVSHPSWFTGSGGLYSTVGDLLRFDEALYSDAVLPAALREAYFKPQVARRGSGQYALGWFIDEIDGKQVISHGGTLEGFVCDYYRYPAEHVAIIVLSNHLVKLGVHVPGELITHASRVLFGGEQEPMPPMLAAKSSRSVSGTYRFENGRAVDIVEERGRVFAIARGDEPWTIFHHEAIDPTTADVQRANKFVANLRDGKYAEVVAMLMPSWRAKAKEEDFRKPWEKLIREHGRLVTTAPRSADPSERLDVVTLTLRFERRDIALEVVMNKESGEIAGWWEMTDVPGARVELLPTSDGGFFADGYRHRLPDLLVRIDQKSMTVTRNEKGAKGARATSDSGRR